MKFSQSVKEYLNGDKFSNGLSVVISARQSIIYDRLSYIENISSGKRVIHLGFADHIPLIEDKIKKNIWLHDRIAKTAARCIGIDINHEAVEYVKTKFDYKGVVCANILTDSIAEIENDKWDYIILGEILEHVENPVEFLDVIRHRYANKISRILITVPNAFAIENFISVLHHVECINTDHKYWFTPYTLAKILIASKIEVINFNFSRNIVSPNPGLRKRLINNYSPNSLLLKAFPAFSSTLIMEGKLLEVEG